MTKYYEEGDLYENFDATEESGSLNLVADDFSQLITAPSDWTIETLYSQIGKQIDLDPAFQRRGVWNSAAKSSFIESIFLGIPIPQILFSSKQGVKGAFLVLDGKQRLLTIKEFIDGSYSDGKPFKLKELRVLKELEGLSWQEISNNPDWKYRLLNETQRTAIIRGWKNEQVLYEIFYRLNSGSVKLSPMELRMSLHPGKFLKFIIRWTENIGALHSLLGRKKPDPRMADVELAIRFLAFNDGNITYRGNLKEFLYTLCIEYNNKFDDQGNFILVVQNKLNELDAAIVTGEQVFGAGLFGRKFINNEYERRFNRAVFDVQVGALSILQVRNYAEQNPEEFKAIFEEVSGDPEFQRSVETTTKSVTSTRIRFEKFYSLLNQKQNFNLAIPVIENEVTD